MTIDKGDIRVQGARYTRSRNVTRGHIIVAPGLWSESTSTVTYAVEGQTTPGLLLSSLGTLITLVTNKGTTMSQDSYTPPPAQQQQANVYTQNSVEQLQGAQHAQTSMILGILSLFFIGIILGPIAISKAKKAEQLHTAATVGKVTGWIGAILGVVGIVVAIIAIIAMVGTAGAMSQMTY